MTHHTPLPFAVGDWVTQYAAGYWQVVAIFDKFATEDHKSATVSWKKGDRLGFWVVLKKGFTAKMKWSNACGLCDSTWCRPVSAEELADIRKAFASEPTKAKKFEEAPREPAPAVINCWLDLPEEGREPLRAALADLPPRFTKERLDRALQQVPGLTVCLPPSAVLLNLLAQPYELDENYDPIYCGYSLD